MWGIETTRALRNCQRTARRPCRGSVIGSGLPRTRRTRRLRPVRNSRFYRRCHWRRACLRGRGRRRSRSMALLASSISHCFSACSSRLRQSLPRRHCRSCRPSRDFRASCSRSPVPASGMSLGHRRPPQAHSRVPLIGTKCSRTVRGTEPASPAGRPRPSSSNRRPAWPRRARSPRRVASSERALAASSELV